MSEFDTFVITNSNIIINSLPFANSQSFCIMTLCTPPHPRATSFHSPPPLSYTEARNSRYSVVPSLPNPVFQTPKYHGYFLKLDKCHDMALLIKIDMPHILKNQCENSKISTGILEVLELKVNII